MGSDFDYKDYYILRDIARNIQETNAMTAEQMASVIFEIAEISRRTQAMYNMIESLCSCHMKNYKGEDENGRTGKEPLRNGGERP